MTQRKWTTDAPLNVERMGAHLDILRRLDTAMSGVHDGLAIRELEVWVDGVLWTSAEDYGEFKTFSLGTRGHP